MINVIGLGYIGLPTALVLAANGVKVTGTDINVKIVNELNSGNLSFEEHGLEYLFKEALKNNIKFKTECIKTDFYIISVPTPYDKVNKRIDPKYIITAVKDVLHVCEKEAILVIESTISPGTIEKHIKPLIRQYSPDKSIQLVHAPERIIPGNMANELVNNSRVIGADDMSIGQKVKLVYSNFCKGEIIVTDIKTAEMSKIVENTYRDINIAYANELAKICRQDKMDVYEIIKIANMHPRVNILQPGPGVGGHCISVDPWFLVGDYPGLANIILAARKINDSMPEFVLERIADIMEKNNINNISRVGLYGLTYKEDVDDVRESPTLQMLDIMKKHLAKGIKVYDPIIDQVIVENQYLNFETFVKDIDMVVIMVGHSQLKDFEYEINKKVVLDTRNFFNNKEHYKL